MRRLCFVLLTVAAQTALLPGAARADLLDVITVAKKAYDVKQAVETATQPLELYANLADELSHHEVPAKPGTPYKFDDMALKLRDEAAALREVAAPPGFDPAGYQVSVDELTHCLTQEASIKKLNDYASALDAAVQAGQETSDKLAKFADEIKDARKLTGTLADASAHLVALPDIGDYFENQWWELAGEIAPALASLEDSRKRLADEVTKNIGLMSTQSQNLKSNLQHIVPNQCLITATYAGRCALDQHPAFHMQEKITLVAGPPESGSWSRLHSYPPSTPLQSIVISNHHISAVIAGDIRRVPFDGTFNDQFTILNAHHTIGTDPTTCLLTGTPSN